MASNVSLTNHHEFYEQYLKDKGSVGEEFQNPVFYYKRDLDPFEEDLFLKRALRDPLFPRNVRVDSGSVTYTHAFKEYTFPLAVLSETQRRTALLLEDFCSFIGYELEKPCVLTPFSSESNVQQDSESALPLYLVGGFRRTITTSLGYTTLSGKSSASEALTKEKSDLNGGFLLAEPQISIQHGVASLVNVQTLPPLVFVGTSSFRNCSAPLSEFLHSAISDQRYQNLVDHFNASAFSLRMYDLPSFSLLHSLREEWLKREESFVHALVFNYLDTHKEMYGFLDTDCDSYTRKLCSQEKFGYFTQLLERVQHDGAEDVYRRYWNDPHSLFPTYTPV